MGNAGFQKLSNGLVEKYDKLFSAFDYVVSPSASCAAYVRTFYPLTYRHPCKAASHTMDLVEFLHDVVRPASLPARFPYTVSLHNSCHGVRELGLSSPSEKVVERYSKMRSLLSLVSDIHIVEPERPDECCGFGGMFSIEEPHVSACMGMDKLERHIQTGADFITGPDSSCLMHLQGLAMKSGKQIQFKHIVEILTAF